MEELISGNFTRPVPERLADVSELAPDFTARESEILLAATVTTARWVAGTALSLGALWRQGGPTSAAERDLERRLTYLHVGPSRPRLTSAQPAPLASPPSSIVSTSDRTTQWVSNMAAGPEQPLTGDDGMELMEVAAEPPRSPPTPCGGDSPAAAPSEAPPPSESGGSRARSVVSRATQDQSSDRPKRAASPARESSRTREERRSPAHRSPHKRGFRESSRDRGRRQQGVSSPRISGGSHHHQGHSAAHHHGHSRHRDDSGAERGDDAQHRRSAGSRSSCDERRRHHGSNDHSCRHGDKRSCCSRQDR